MTKTPKQNLSTKLIISLFLLPLALIYSPVAPAAKHADGRALLITHSASLSVPVTGWKARRDQGIVKQNFDYSCGAASLATILNSYYRQHISELQLLQTPQQRLPPYFLAAVHSGKAPPPGNN